MLAGNFIGEQRICVALARLAALMPCLPVVSEADAAPTDTISYCRTRQSFSSMWVGV